VPEYVEVWRSTGVAQAARPRSRTTSLPAGWPVYLLFGAFPLWWILGLGPLIWALLAVPMLLRLLGQPSVRIPKGFGLWIGFLGWMLITATQLNQPKLWIAYSYRTILYFSMTILFVYLYNLPRSIVPIRKMILLLTLFWAFVIGFGFLALALPEARVVTPAARLLPASIAANPFVQQLFNPRLAQVQSFTGYPVTRPAAPFAYTNEWGGAVALLTPMAIASLTLLRSYLLRNLVRVLLVASLVPIVVSSNRGLWVGLGVGLVYMAVRVAFRGNARALVAIVGFLAVIVTLVAFTPLKKPFQDRLAHQHSNERRESLATGAIEGWKQSPMFGYGGPRELAVNPDAPNVGTHGQFYLVLFSHGLPGTLLFLGWWLWAFWMSLRGAAGPPLWVHVVLLIGMLEFFYYDMIPTQLSLMMVAAALAWREREAVAAQVLAARARLEPSASPATR
jgi:polysaccharide biosynthesis protein PslJ